MSSRYTCRNCGKELSGNWLYCSHACQYAARLRRAEKSRYGHETLPGAARYRPCSECGQFHKRNSQYCSNACKQAAYRKRHDPASGTYARRRQRANQAARSKATWKTHITCEHCGHTVRMSVAESTNRRYCSNACKQAAYRARKRQAK